MKISLITISFNSASTILNTLKSVKNQDFKDFEHFLIDSDSKDETLKIAKKFSDMTNIFSEPDNGIYHAFNKGIKKSTGEIIGFLNSDDTFFDSTSLNIISESFDDNTDCIFGDLIYTNRNEKIKRIWKSAEFQPGVFKKGWMPAHPTFYCRRSIYEKLGMYDEDYKIAGDYELMLRFLEKNRIRSKYVNHTLVNMKVGGISNKTIKSKIDILKEEFRAFKKNKIELNKTLYFYHKLKKIKEFKI
ncbi:MAG: glycosyltransferase family 2 protein [Flavobacteriaceae bacterium]